MPSSNSRFVGQADSVLARLAAELSKPSNQRSIGVSDNQLRYVYEVVGRMKADFMQNSLPAKEHRQPVLTRLVADEWPAVSDLGTAAVEVEEMYINL